MQAVTCESSKTVNLYEKTFNRIFKRILPGVTIQDADHSNKCLKARETDRFVKVSRILFRCI